MIRGDIVLSPFLMDTKKTKAVCRDFRKIVFMQIEQHVKALVSEIISDREDLFLVDVKMHGNGKLVVWVDGDQGITIQDCADISRQVGNRLEEGELIDHAYNLEVSSPGIDEPLQSHRQYVKNVGRNVQVKTRTTTEEGGEKTEISEGKLLSVTDDHIRLEKIIKNKNLPKGRKPPVEEVEMPFDKIVATKVLISFK